MKEQDQFWLPIDGEIYYEIERTLQDFYVQTSDPFLGLLLGYLDRNHDFFDKTSFNEQLTEAIETHVAKHAANKD